MPPVFGHGQMRLYLLSLLDESPKHGYELITALGDRFGGTYVPSAGTIYPRLAKLEQEGMVTKESDGRKTVYAITDAGRAELARRADELDAIEHDVTDSVRRLADEVRGSVDQAMRSLRAELAAAAREARAEAKADLRFGTTTEGTSRTRGERPTHPDAEAPTADGSRVHREEARGLLQEADAALTSFRMDLRAELRRAAQAGTLGADAVDGLVRALADLRATTTASLTRR